MAEKKYDKRYEREAMLIGEETLLRLSEARVALFGVGGVGSYAAEGVRMIPFVASNPVLNWLAGILSLSGMLHKVIEI